MCKDTWTHFTNIIIRAWCCQNQMFGVGKKWTKSKKLLCPFCWSVLLSVVTRQSQNHIALRLSFEQFNEQGLTLLWLNRIMFQKFLNHPGFEVDWYFDLFSVCKIPLIPAYRVWETLEFTLDFKPRVKKYAGGFDFSSGIFSVPSFHTVVPLRYAQ